MVLNKGFSPVKAHMGAKTAPARGFYESFFGFFVVWSTIRKRVGKAYVDQDYRFHDHKLSKIIASGRHAVALDEQRQHFHSEPWGEIDLQNSDLGFGSEDSEAPIQEKFFPGDHGSVGGGGDIRGLSDAAFDWICDGAKNVGLTLDSTPTSSIFAVLPDYQAPLRNTTKPPKKFSLMRMLVQTRNHKPENLNKVHESAQRRWTHGDKFGNEYRSHNLLHLRKELDALDFEPPLTRKIQRGKIEFSPEGGSFFYHTIVKGETLGKLAKRFLGDSKLYKKLYEANAGTISDPDKIYVGQIIRIPFTDKNVSN